jgi:peroxiredoxin
MSLPSDYSQLPENLPVPIDDGACDHLVGQSLPAITLISTAGRQVNLSELEGRVVLYCYPFSGRPGVALPEGWNEIPGARGCTPQSCAFRDHYQEILSLGAQVFGLSTQHTDYQKELAERIHLPFEILSDSGLEFANQLSLPTFEVDLMTLIKRLTLIVNDGKIEKVFYPVFPPDKNAGDVIEWLSTNSLK